MNIVNLSSELPWHATRRWSTRELSHINKIIIHQELGESSIENVNHYHINPNHISSKGCPHFCYHYGIRKDDDKDGEIVQANELSSVTWHTKGQNTVAIGIMLQGNFSGTGHDLGVSEPTDKQLKSLTDLTGYLITSFDLKKQDVFGHYHFGKPACPGYKVQKWIEEYRNDLVLDDKLKEVTKTVTEVQKRLNKLGYACGNADGIVGIKTNAAIRRFQADNQLVIDGIVGPQTWTKLLLLTSK